MHFHVAQFKAINKAINKATTYRAFIFTIPLAKNV